MNLNLLIALPAMLCPVMATGPCSAAQATSPKPTAQKGHNGKSKERSDEALFIAVDKGQIKQVQILLKQGASPNTVQMSIPGGGGHDHTKTKEEISDVGDPSFLRMKMTPLIRAIINDDLPIARILLEHGANVNAKGWHNRTPIIWASDASNKPIIDLLIKFKAGLNAKSDEGFTALSLAESFNKLDIASKLRKAGARE
jgi:ankyrin repeat protein